MLHQTVGMLCSSSICLLAEAQPTDFLAKWQTEHSFSEAEVERALDAHLVLPDVNDNFLLTEACSKGVYKEDGHRERAEVVGTASLWPTTNRPKKQTRTNKCMRGSRTGPCIYSGTSSLHTATAQEERSSAPERPPQEHALETSSPFVSEA